MFCPSLISRSLCPRVFPFPIRPSSISPWLETDNNSERRAEGDARKVLRQHMESQYDSCFEKALPEKVCRRLGRAASLAALCAAAVTRCFVCCCCHCCCCYVAAAPLISSQHASCQDFVGRNVVRLVKLTRQLLEKLSVAYNTFK